MQILAVMVRYKMPLEESRTLRGLMDAFAEDPALGEGFRVLIWDNSPDPLINPQLPESFLYRHSKANLGPSGAFNEALRYACEHGHAWMLLLDQDMEIHVEFLRALVRHQKQVKNLPEVAAIVPTVCAGGTVVSPRRQLLHDSRPYPAQECGVAKGEATAINSGSLVRVSAIEEIGGFSADFWLDYSDFYLFHQLFLRGMKIWRAADVTLRHTMTVMDYEHSMSPWRYRNFSHAEEAFNDLYKSALGNALQTVRVLARAIKQRMKYKNREFSRIAWEQLIYRLTTPKKQRLRRWREDSARRQAASG